MDSEAHLLAHSGLAETGVTASALLDGAVAGLSLAKPYCKYLSSALMQAVTTATDESIHQPQLIVYTVFAEIWHCASLACLSDADIANAARLADYLMLDAVCICCLTDVSVQRQLRSGVKNSLLPESVSAGAHARVLKALDSLPTLTSFVNTARGLTVPTDTHYVRIASKWGHWDLMLQARAAGVEWRDVRGMADAAWLGHLPMLRQLRQHGCAWDEGVISSAWLRGHECLAIWALDNGAPSPDNWLDSVARSGCLRVLRWAWEHGRNTQVLPRLKQAAFFRTDVVKWLDSLPATVDT
jgi:hypothetical protein